MPSIIQFAGPGWLWMLPVAAALPVLAHLLSRQVRRTAVFSSLRFIQTAQRSSRRHQRVRDWLLLAMRCLLLLLIVAACARPMVRERHADVTTANGTLAVFILDRSASMNRPWRGTPLIDHAKREAAERLVGLDPRRDKAMVILLDSEPAPLLPEATANFDHLRSAITNIQPTHQRGRFDAALHLATRLAQSQARPSHPGDSHHRISLTLISDMQATQEPRAESPDALLGAAELTRVPVGEVADNLAVYDPVHSPPHPRNGEAVDLHVKVANFGAHAKTTAVRLHLNGMEFPADTRDIRIAAGQVQSVTLRYHTTRAGVDQVKVSLRDEDAYAADNESRLFITCGMRRRLALATWSQLNNTDHPGRYVAVATVPKLRGGATPDGQYRFTSDSRHELAIVRPKNLAAFLSGRDAQDMPAAAPDVVLLCDAGNLPRNTLQAMRSYLEQGGGVLWFVDSPEAVDALKGFETLDRKTTLLPIAPDAKQPWRDGDIKAGRSLTPGRDVSALPILADPAMTPLLGVPSFKAVMAGKLADGATALLSFSDGLPAVASRAVGAGRLVVFAADISPGRSDLTTHPTFVVLLHELAKHAAHGETFSRNVHPGDRAVIPLRERIGPTRWRLLDAQDAEIANGKIEPGDTTITTPRLTRPGAYRLFDEDDTLIGGIGVEIDPAESDLRRADSDPTGPAADTSPGESEQTITPAASRQVARVTGGGIELWPYLLAAALALAAIEHGMLAWMGRSRRNPESSA